MKYRTATGRLPLSVFWHTHIILLATSCMTFNVLQLTYLHLLPLHCLLVVCSRETYVHVVKRHNILVSSIDSSVTECFSKTMSLAILQRMYTSVRLIMWHVLFNDTAYCLLLFGVVILLCYLPTCLISLFDCLVSLQLVSNCQIHCNSCPLPVATQLMAHLCVK